MGFRVAAGIVICGLTVPWVSAQVPAGGEFRVNTHTTNRQSGFFAASDASGNFVVTWTSQYQDGSGPGVFAQRYDASGAPRGAEFRVNSYTTDFQSGGPVASDAAGNFVIAWTSYIQEGSDRGVFAQRFDASGAPRGAEFLVNTYTTGTQLAVAVASDAAGDFVVVWYSAGEDGSGLGVFAQRFDATGARLGAEFQVNTYTTGTQSPGSVASDADGNFVVAWSSEGQDGNSWGVFAQRYDASGTPRGAEFQVNTYTTDRQYTPSVASDAAGNFVIVWTRSGVSTSTRDVFAQRYDSTGTPLGAEFRVNTYTTDAQSAPSVASDASGNFVVSWTSGLEDGSGYGVFAQRYDATGATRGSEFRVNTYTTGSQMMGRVASDPVGNFVVIWTSSGQDGSSDGVFAQRYGGLVPAALALDSVGNGILEPGVSIDVRPSWRNVNGATQGFGGSGLSFTGPAASGVTYVLQDAAASYGTVANGATAQCSDCYQLGIALTGARPSTHWDARFLERLTPDAFGQTKSWTLHVGDSFTDVPRASGYYNHVETLLHTGVTAGCGVDTYCPSASATRQQMTVFTLKSKEGSSYSPPGCGPLPVFPDVPVTSAYCPWVEEMWRRGIVSGCGGGNFCPTNAVTRAQMAVFVLKTLDPTLDPPPCGTPMFPDVPASSPFCAWVEELARRGVVSGCGGGNYCPTSPVTRGQMGVFLTLTFELTLYGA